jgi:hypothetical protein
MSQKTCPHCGASVDASRSTCPNCRAVITKKSSLTPYLIVAGIVAVIILVVVILLISPGPGTTIEPPATVSPTKAMVSSPTAPSCTIAITGSKVPPSSIRLQVMTSTCSAAELSGLRVSVNGAEKGTLGTSPGVSGTFAGESGTNTVIVVAKFANGAESVVYQGTL